MEQPNNDNKKQNSSNGTQQIEEKHSPFSEEQPLPAKETNPSTNLPQIVEQQEVLSNSPTPVGQPGDVVDAKGTSNPSRNIEEENHEPPPNSQNENSPQLEERNPSISSTIIFITAIVVCLVLFAVLLWALYPPSPPAPPSCQYGWNYFNGSCYKLYSNKVGYNAAEAECRENNANVVSIHSEQEQKFVNDLREGSWTWLGLKHDSKWSWSDGSDVDYTNWEDGHPMLIRTLTNMRRDTGKWESKTSLDNNFFICKKPK
ncbi:unnamed protein product, partial [Mesorhabditis belari]|uniref:C-type lectin domain-containing protein n=1 Tax=Mesorhabditis belari TaxID=2138241 RepID=A0AAF3EGK4_9BILA